MTCALLDMQEFLQAYEGPIMFSTMVVVLILAAVCEAVFPRRQNRSGLGYRWANNVGLSIIEQLNSSYFTIFAVIGITWWAEGRQLALVQVSDLGLWPSVILAVLVFDFIAYWFHRALHEFPWLWRIHAVHHSDTEIDFTTTYRNHPFELYIISPIVIPTAVLLGFSAASVVIYQLLRMVISIFAHSNIRLPRGVDQQLRRFVVTPDYHRVHHSSERPFTNSNYCTAFPWYDYLFGTARFKPYEEQDEMSLGLEYFRAPQDLRLDRLLLMPFVWRRREMRPVADANQNAAGLRPEAT